MGTRNFATPNASKHYVIFENESYFEVTCSTCEHEHDFYYSEDECPTCCAKCQSEDLIVAERYYDYHDEDRKDMQHCLKELLPEMDLVDFESDNDRNYSTIYMGEIVVSKYYLGWPIDIQIKIGYTCGYYEAALLDWFAIEEDEIIQNWADSVQPSEKMTQYLQPLIQKWIKKTKNEVVSKIESAFEKAASNQLQMVGSFSNGECIYERI